MIKIVQLNKYYAPHRGGIETVVQNIAECLCGKTEMCVCVCNENNHSEFENKENFFLHRSNTQMKIGPMPISFSYLKDVRKVTQDADLVLLHTPFPWGDLALRLSGYKGKVLIWWHSDIVRQKKLFRLYKPLMKWTLRRADRIIVATQGLIDGSCALAPYKEKCVIIPYGVDNDFYQLGKHLPYKPSKGQTTFLFVGRMVYYKGCDILVRAFSAMKNKNCRLEFIGLYTDMTEKCRALAEEIGVSDRISFLGDLPREDLKQHLADCDVFVLPSILRSEAFALVQLEAMAFGKPVINTNLPSGVPHVSRNGETGITVEPGNVQELAHAMDTLATDRALRERYAERALERIEDFRMDLMQERLLHLMKSVISEE